VVTNVAAFGAFVDVGVHQDGLVHVSAMSNTFVKDPRDVAKPGDIVRVRVVDVDIPRKRISLTMRLDDEARPPSPRPGQAKAGPPAKPNQGAKANQAGKGNRPRTGGGGSAPDTALAEALRRAGLA
jgi:uncharacterized protein